MVFGLAEKSYGRRLLLYCFLNLIGRRGDSHGGVEESLDGLSDGLVVSIENGAGVISFIDATSGVTDDECGRDGLADGRHLDGETTGGLSKLAQPRVRPRTEGEGAIVTGESEGVAFLYMKGSGETGYGHLG